MSLLPCGICGKKSNSVEEYVKCLMDCETVKTNKFVHESQIKNSHKNKTQEPPNLLQHKNGKKWYEPDIPIVSPATSCFKIFL